MTQVIVKEGGEFGANVEMKSQVMLSNEKKYPRTDIWPNDKYPDSKICVKDVSRTAFNKTLGLSPIRSHRKKCMVRKQIMVLKKMTGIFLISDWPNWPKLPSSGLISLEYISLVWQTRDCN